MHNHHEHILHETQVFATDAPRHLAVGRNGRPVHPLTILRWINHGVRGVKLEAVRLGHRWVTSVEALKRFTSRLTSGNDGVPIRLRTTAARDRQLSRAEAVADAEGL